MKKFLLGLVVAIALTCVWGITSAKIQQHNAINAIKERDRAVKAEQAARAASETAAPQAPIR
jgi:hypothetical protein